MAAPGVAQLDPRHWKSPNTFDPYRWIRGEVEQVDDGDDTEKVDFGFGAISTGANSYYLPFGAGRHRCIGEHTTILCICVLKTRSFQVNSLLTYSWLPS